jgi:membrane protein
MSAGRRGEPHWFFEHSRESVPGLSIAQQGWRLVLVAGRGFFRDEGLYRASALAFDTMLGLVPFLAFFVSTLKGFGAYQTLMRNVIRPGIVRTMIAMGAERDSEAVGLLGIFLKILDIVEQASFGTLGAFGLVFLLYIVALLLVSVEETMNHIFGVEKSRSLTRKLTDYSAILFIAPLSTILAAAAASGASRYSWLRLGFFSQGTAAALMFVCLTCLYWVMPYRRVRLRSAAVGGLLAGVAWYVVLVVYVHFQVGVTRYNALYSTFAAIPLFLVWMFVSWIVVLYGAELAAAHDKPELYRWRIRGRDVDHRSRLFIALRALGEMARTSRSGRAPLVLSELAQETNLPAELLRTELDRFVSHQLLVRSQEQGEPRYAIARDLDSISVGEVTALLETSQADSGEGGPEDARTWQFVDERLLTRSDSVAMMSLRQFSQSTDDPAEVVSQVPLPRKDNAPARGDIPSEPE